MRLDNVGGSAASTALGAATEMIWPVASGPATTVAVSGLVEFCRRAV